MRRSSARRRVPRDFYTPEFGTGKKKTKKGDLRLSRVNISKSNGNDDADFSDEIHYDQMDGEEDIDEDYGSGSRGRKIKRGKGGKIVLKRGKGVNKHEEYYVDVDNMKVSPERKDYLRNVFKKESHMSCIENILRRRKKGGDVPDLSELSSPYARDRREKKFGQPLSVHEIRELNRKEKPYLQKSLVRNV